MTSKTVEGIACVFGRATQLGALLVSLATAGCSERNASDPNEPVAGSIAPLGEAACATLPATAVFSEPEYVLDYSSPNSYSISGCYRAVIVDALNYGQFSNPTGAVVAWNAATPTTQATCENAWVAAKVYKDTAGAWEALGSASASGTWFQERCIPPSLVWSSADLPSGASYRFAASARVSATGVTRSVRVFAERSQCVADDPRSPALNPADPTTITSFAQAAAPLYVGSGASQRPVANAAIDPAHLAVVQGTVVDSTGNAVSCAEVSAVGAPQYGVTHTFSDGSFAMVVNGGGRVTVRVRQSGYFSSDRTVDTVWNRFAIAAPIRLLPLPANADYVSVTQAGATVAGAVETDAQGTRQGVLIVPPGTHATVSGGAAQDSYKIAIKEVTNLQNYPARDAMPGSLPPQSAFTYAMQLVVQGAEEKDVTFDKPIPFYVENFILSTTTTANDTVGFPVGEAVPVGRYDRTLGKWVAEENGVVLKLVGVNTAGEAKIDFIPNAGEAGTGADDTTSLGTTSTELQSLAARYCPGGNCSGKQLWRFTTNHFSAWDVNWGWGPPPNAGPPSPPPPPPPPPRCTQVGSIVECQTQVLREKIPVTATPFNLVYSSERQAGSSRRLSIPVTDATIPSGVKRVELQIEVGGRLIRPTPPQLQAPNIVGNYVYPFEWDGKDVAGRRLYGPQPVTVRIGYVYQGSYVRTPRFGYNGNGLAISGSVPRFEATLWRAPWNGFIGSVDARYPGLGGWTVDVHHQFDSLSGVVYLGDGTTTDAPPSELNTIAGDLTPAGGAAPPPIYPATPVPATTRQIAAIDGSATAPDGTTYIAAQNRIHRVANGLIDTILVCPGTNQCSSVRLAVGLEGDVYMSSGRHCIQKIEVNNGMAMSTVAGVCGTAGLLDGVASLARFNGPTGIAFASDGTLYIADLFNGKVRVLRDGVVSTLPGTINSGPWNLAVGLDGSIYFTAQTNIRKYSVDGTLSTYVSVAANGIAIGPDGLLYVGGSSLVRRVNADKTLTTVVGNGNATPRTEHLLPTQSTMNGVRSVGFDASGAIYATQSSAPNLLRKTMSNVAGMATSARTVPSKDAQQLYVFDGGGKHLKTLDARTGAAVYTFGYASSGALVSVIDASGQETTITRDTSGKATAIIAPELQETTLNVDASADPAILKKLIRPDSSSYTFEYESGGLLKSLRDPKSDAEGGGNYTFHYTNGLLDQDTDPRSGAVAQTLSRVEFPTGTTVTHTSPGGKQTTYKTETLNALRTSTVTHPDQLPVIEKKQMDGALAFQAPSNGRSYDTLLTRADGTKFYSKQGLEASSGTTYTSEELTEMPSGLKRLDERTVATTRNAATGVIESQTVTSVRNGDTTNKATETYDGATRTLTFKSRQGRESTMTFDALGRVSQTRRSAVPIGFDFAYASGRLTDIIQADTQIRRKTHYDYYFGYLFSVTEGDVGTPVAPLPRVTTYAPDLLGRPLSQTVAGNTTVMSWDGNSSLATLTPPDKPEHGLSYTPINQLKLYSSPTASGPSGPTSYTYNADRQVETEIRPGGTTLTWNYDSAGRKDTLTTGTTTLLDYDYYLSPALAGGAAGRVKSLKARTGANGVNLGFQYDGQLTTQVAWSGAAVGSTIGGTVDWTYNSDFLPATETAKGSYIKFGYDLDGLPVCAATSSAGCTAPSATDELRVTRDPQNGLVTGISLGNVTEEFVYNEFGELASHNATYSGTPLMALTYDQGVDPYKRDALGRITRKYESFNGATVTVFDYVYDAAGQLTEVWKGNAPVARRERFTYDANGNRRSSSLTSTTQRIFTDNQDRIINYGGTAANTTSGGVIYNYTANGEVASEVLGSQTWSFNYDLLGNLISTQVPGGPLTEYLVDGQNRRVAKKVGGTLVKQWLYRDSLSPVAELDGTGAVVSRFVYVSRPNIPDFVIRGTKTYRLLSDHLGSPRMAVNVADVNDVPFRADYTAFGVQTMLNGTAADWIPFGFAGGLADPEMGLIRFGARDYESGSGRWMQRDPIRFAGGANLYAYAMNDPVNFIDRTGHQPIPIPWWGPIAGGAAAGAAAGSAVGGVGAIPGALAGAALMCLMLTSDTPEEPPEICQLQYEWGNECVYICPESGTVIKTRRHGGPSTLNPANDVCPRTIIYG